MTEPDVRVLSFVEGGEPFGERSSPRGFTWAVLRGEVVFVKWPHFGQPVAYHLAKLQDVVCVARGPNYDGERA